MAKDKKKHSKSDDLSANLLDMAAQSVKKFRKVTKQISKLSTGQKLVGGVALLAAGLTYLSRQAADQPTTSEPDEAAPDQSEAARKRKKPSPAAS
ncbi:MAG: hypothetical protein ACRYFX_05035 [Janthinobacterium lividum]